MKIGPKMKIILPAMLGLAFLPAALGADDALKDQKEKVSYAIGMNVGNNLKRGGFDIDVEILAGAIRDVMAGKETKINETQAREALNAYQKDLSAKRDEERKKTADKNKADGAAWLAENKRKTGVKVQEVKLPDGTMAELQYKVITEGPGTFPKTNDTVSVNYKGTLIDGKEFDSSAKHGQPGKFQLNRVIKGWTEALQMMKVGSKWELYLPSTLAYGDYPSGPDIQAGSTLIFEVELLSIDTPPPLTSDIIRVPSAEELKNGAKVEVIKPEDVEKAKADAEKAAKKP